MRLNATDEKIDAEDVDKNDTQIVGMERKSGAVHSDAAVAGAVSGFITRLICQPLDVVKIRFQGLPSGLMYIFPPMDWEMEKKSVRKDQIGIKFFNSIPSGSLTRLQVEPISHQHVSKYKSMLHAARLIIKEEGIIALWNGHVPAQLLSVVYGAAQFYSYNEIKKISDTVQTLPEWKKSVNFAAGAAAGCVATIVSFPFDTVRTRLVAQSSNNQIYRGFIHPYKTILKTESPRSFFRGLLPTLLQIAPHAGLQFTFYNIFTDAYKRLSLETQTNIGNSMIAGSSAGVISKTIVYPFDLARKRLQIQGFEHGRKGFGKFFSCYGLIDCIVTTVKVEGFTGLFKGLVPSQLKAAATTALHFTVYEQVLLILKASRQ